jgi:hypothetical protein
MTAAGRKIQWCHRCHHAIARLNGTLSQGRWGHVSDDDWAGPQGECRCTWDLTPCSPRTARNQGRRVRPRVDGITADHVVYDEVQVFTAPVVKGFFNGELTEYGRTWVATEILKLADPPA